MSETFIQIRKLLISLCVAAVLSASGFSQAETTRIMPPEFKSDGCTLFPDGNYRDCCVEHDKAYYFGGTLKERRAADDRLYECVKAKNGSHSKIIAGIMWLGVRIGGVSFLPTSFRWGFGNKYPRMKVRKTKTPANQKSY